MYLPCIINIYITYISMTMSMDAFRAINIYSGTSVILDILKVRHHWLGVTL